MSIQVCEDSGVIPEILYDSKYLLNFCEQIKITKKNIKPDVIRYFVTFQNKPLIFKMPEMKVMFGPILYTGNNEQKTDKWSLHFSLDDSTLERYEFRVFLETMDMIAFQYFKPEPYKLVSACRPCYKDITKFPTFRIKLPIYQNKVVAKVYYENILLNSDLDTFKKMVTHGVIAKAILECNGLWYVQEQYGITYKLKVLKIIAPKIEI